MTEYYCDITASTFSDRDGSDSESNVLTGPAGLQAAFRGTGSATALAPGDTVFLKTGTGELARLVLLECTGTSVAGWGIGDVVHNRDAGSTWSGVVVETNSGGFLGSDDIVMVWLDSGYDRDDIVVADGVTNDDAADAAGDPTDVDPLAAVSTPGISIHTIGSATNPVRLIGVGSSWTSDGSMAILDGTLKATVGFSNSAIASYFEFRNIHVRRTVYDPWAKYAGLRYCNFVHCIASEGLAGGFGTSNYNQYGSMVNCRAYDNVGGRGFRLSSGPAINCTAYNNSVYGFELSRATLVNCVAFENFVGVYGGSGSGLVNCVLDKNGSGVQSGSYGLSAVGCRITNNTSYGVKGDELVLDPYCFYSGNGASFENDIHDDRIAGVSTRVTSGVVGYIDNDDATANADRNYGLTNAAAARRQAVTL